MYSPVLEYFEHEGWSAPSSVRADQQRVPSSSHLVVLTTQVPWLRIVTCGLCLGQGKKEWSDQHVGF